MNAAKILILPERALLEASRSELIQMVLSLRAEKTACDEKLSVLREKLAQRDAKLAKLTTSESLLLEVVARKNVVNVTLDLDKLAGGDVTRQESPVAEFDLSSLEDAEDRAVRRRCAIFQFHVRVTPGDEIAYGIALEQ